MPAPGAVKIGDDVPYEVAALVGCGVMTGVGAVINTADVRPGSTVVVIGCGGVGIAAIQGARLAGAAVIVGGRHRGVQARGGPAVRRHPRGHPGRPERPVHRRSPVARASTTRSTWSPCRRPSGPRGSPPAGAGPWSSSAPVAPTTRSSSARSSCCSRASGSCPSLYGSADVPRDYPPAARPLAGRPAGPRGHDQPPAAARRRSTTRWARWAAATSSVR